MTEKNFQQGNNLQGRARRYAHVIAALFQRQNLSGSLKIASRGARHLSLGVRLSDPTMLDRALKLSESMALASGSENVLAQRIEGIVSYQFQLNCGYWEHYTREDLPDSQSVGLGEQRKPIKFSLDPPHSLIAGTTGSGKSVALKTILLSLVSTHEPDQLNLILIDPNHDYDDFENITHLALPIARDPETIKNALSYGNQLLLERIGSNIKDGKTLVIGIDEGEDVLNDKANLACAVNIARQGRKYCINLLLSTSRPNHTDLPGLLDKLMSRYIGLLSDANLSARLTGHSGLAAHKLTGKGDFLHIVGSECSRFQIAMATQKDFDDLPRAEIAKVAVEDHDIVILPEPDHGGRPQLIVDPRIVATYFWHNPKSVSISVAKKSFGLSRDGHKLHKNFTVQFIDELKKLRGK